MNRLLFASMLATAPAAALAQDDVQPAPLPDITVEAEPVVVPDDLLPPAPPEDPVAVLAASDHPDATVFQAFLASADAQAIFRRHGFGIAPGGRR